MEVVGGGVSDGGCGGVSDVVFEGFGDGQTDRRTDRRTDIGGCRVAFATENNFK